MAGHRGSRKTETYKSAQAVTFCYRGPSRLCTLTQDFLILHVENRYLKVARELTSRVGLLTFDLKSYSLYPT